MGSRVERRDEGGGSYGKEISARRPFVGGGSVEKRRTCPLVFLVGDAPVVAEVGGGFDAAELGRRRSVMKMDASVVGAYSSSHCSIM